MIKAIRSSKSEKRMLAGRSQRTVFTAEAEYKFRNGYEFKDRPQAKRES